MLLQILTQIILLTAQTQASDPSCVQEYLTQTGEEKTVSQTCESLGELELSWTSNFYKYLKDNPRRVQFWQGGYKRTVFIRQTFLRQLVNNCNGKIISEKTIIYDSLDKVEFRLDNPNLNPNIQESYMLVPLTQLEAEQELKEAKKRCKNY